MDYKETLNAMTLARLSYYSQASILLLYRKAGSATAVIDNYDTGMSGVALTVDGENIAVTVIQ